MRPSLIAQKHSGALLSGGKPGNPGHNHLTVRQRAQAVRGQLIGRSEHSSRRVAEGRPSLCFYFAADEPGFHSKLGPRSEALAYGPHRCFHRSLAGARGPGAQRQRRE